MSIRHRLAKADVDPCRPYLASIGHCFEPG